MIKKVCKRIKMMLVCATASCSVFHFANGAPLPDVVSQPAGLNLGSTSYYDGFGLPHPGFVFLDFLRLNDSDSISGPNGRENPAFSRPNVTALVNLFQGVWISPVHFAGGYLGATALLPIISISSSFGARSRVLTNNNTNVGDLIIGPVYQGLPIFSGGRPVFVQRFVFLVTVPTGAFNHAVNLNQGSGYWSINPYWAVTALPLPSLELSARFNFLYNFKTTDFGNPPKVPHVTFLDAQAGEAGFVNFAASYAVTKKLSFGVNGYYFDQFVNDRVNGENIPQSRKSALYFGPGAHFSLSRTTNLNFNLYLPIKTANVANGPQFNIQYVHNF